VHRLFSHIHTLVKREGAEHYLLYSLLSFAASVSLTRLFLELTGYPQLGNSELHIAHVLWGGLLLFIASLLPLVLANRWVYTIGGILSGAGVGLFIDEVGKFITQSNDYFYPPAAPIIYAFFLLVVLFYLRVRRSATEEPRAELYRAFDALQEVLDHDLDQYERAQLTERLTRVYKQAKHPNHAALAQALLDFVAIDSLELVPERPTLEDQLRSLLDLILDRYLPRRLFRWLLVMALLVMGLGALADLLAIIPGSLTWDNLFILLLRNGDEASANLVFLSLARLSIEIGVGLALVTGALLFIVGREHSGSLIAYFGLLTSLTVLNLLVFYFDQFSAILLAIVQFAVFMSVSTYRQRYLLPNEEEVVQSVSEPHSKGS
jgi:hypothetical protein